MLFSMYVFLLHGFQKMNFFILGHKQFNNLKRIKDVILFTIKKVTFFLTYFFKCYLERICSKETKA